MLLKIIILSVIVHVVFGRPPNDKALFDQNDQIEERRRRRPPCRGRNDEGRTFLDWSFQHLDVNYNYNFNINCGEGGGGGNKPGLLGGNKPGGGLGGNKPGGGGLFGGNHQGGNRPILGGILGGLFSQAQSQAQGIGTAFNDFASSLFPQGGNGLGSFLPQGGFGSLIPQGGLFNGQGIGSLFENGLFSNIFDRPSVPSVPSVPPVPPPSNPISPVQPTGITNGPPIITTPKPDPDDIIYNDEKPVHEDHDDVVPDAYSNFRPGQYLVASNPIFGQFVADLSDLNPFKQINKRFGRSLANRWRR